MATTTSSGAKILLNCLVREGVDCMFGYPGGVTLPLYDALYDHQIRHVLVRHEQNAAFAAQGYARTTGKVGVCCATSGPGATNLVTGLVDAMMDSIPIVAITGQVSNKLMGTDAFQEADTFGITRSATKHNFLVKNVNDLPQIIHEAFYIAASGRPGPVLVDVTKDAFQGQAHYAPVTEIHLPGYRVFSEGHSGQIRRAAQMIWEADRPFVYAGGGIIAANASDELRELVETIDAPAVCTLMGLGALPCEHPNFISMPGMHGSYAANMGMTETDLIIALGVRFDDRVTGRLNAFAPHAKIIHVDVDPAEIGKNRYADLPIVGDAKKVLPKLTEALRELAPEMSARKSDARGAWRKQIADWKAEHPLKPEFSETEIKPQHLMAEIDRLSGGRAIVASDVGQHQMWSAQLIRYNEPRLWINSGGLGSMGFGLPAAIGAQFARPDKLVFAIVGDGGFQMSIPELATIANHALPIKIIVMNNGYLGMVRQWQEMFYNNRLSQVELTSFPDPEKLAGAYGFKGSTVEDVKEMPRVLEEAVRAPGPYLLNVKVSSFENVFPMVPAGGALNEMVLRPPQTGVGVGERNVQQIISLVMENKPGALMRVTGLLGQRGYNIESLTVARTTDPTLSRMTITVDVEPNIRAQVIKQMNKLINVLQATDATDGPAVNRELLLVRIRTTQVSRTAVLKEAEIFGARVVDSTVEGFALEATGDSEKLDEFIDVMRSYGEIEISRSGIVSMSLDNKKLRLSAPVPRGAAPEEALELQETE